MPKRNGPVPGTASPLNPSLDSYHSIVSPTSATAKHGTTEINVRIRISFVYFSQPLPAGRVGGRIIHYNASRHLRPGRVPMRSKDFLDLAKDPNFISGIYNYCDRWCERCAFTSRCFLYATEKS